MLEILLFFTNQLGKVIPREMRYTMKAMYAPVKATTTDVNNIPLTAEDKESIKR